MSVPRETYATPVVVSRETAERIAEFKALLRKWSRQINLVSNYDLHDLDRRHIADSLSLLPLLPAHTRRAIDLGSGAGFPGLIVAITSGVHFDLIEADHRKAAFLVEAARLTHAPVTIIADRIEHARCSPATLITSRALAPLDHLLALAVPHLANGGICLFPKGRAVEAELKKARMTWKMSVVQHSSAISSEGVVLEISKISRVT